MNVGGGGGRKELQGRARQGGNWKLHQWRRGRPKEAPRFNHRHYRHDHLLFRRRADISSVTLSVASPAQLHLAVCNYMALLATLQSPPHEDTTFGGFGAVAITTGSHARVTTGLAAGVCTPFSGPSSLIWLAPQWINLDKCSSSPRPVATK